MTKSTKTGASAPKRKRGKSSFFRQYLRALRFYLVTGLLVWIPLIITVWLAWWLFKNVGLGLERLIENAYLQLNELGSRTRWLGFFEHIKYRTGVGFLITIALFLTTGFFTRYLVGRRIINAGERILDRIPIVSRIYRAIQQIRDVFVRREGTVFQSVCLIEYPRKGIFAVAFVTSTDQGVVHEALEKNMVSVFVPTTPNPTSGFLLYLDPAEVIPLDIGIEEAMKLIISGGAYLPGSKSVEAALNSSGMDLASPTGSVD